ncbi:MAG: hypothetical protein RLZ57_1083, partial [Actinomycetota bacterium]
TAIAAPATRDAAATNVITFFICTFLLFIPGQGGGKSNY